MQMKAEFHDDLMTYEYSADGEYCPDYRKYYALLDTVQLEKIKVGDLIFQRPFAAGSMEAIAAELALELAGDLEFEVV